MSKPTIGFVGLGAMGFGMATNLVKEGYPVHGFDVFAASVERFKRAGGIPAASLRESAEGKDYYVCMVASAPQVQEVLFGEEGVVQALPRNATLLLCSTVPAPYAQSVSEQLASPKHGRSDINFIDCPVSGGAKRAAGGTLSIMAGGSDTAVAKGKFLLQAMSDINKLYIVPGGVGAGSNMKMVHQVLAAIQILGASEAMGFAARLGLDAVQTQKAINESEAWTWMFENRLPRMVGEQWDPKVSVSAVTIILKDVGIITASARSHQFPTPLASTAEQIYLSTLSQGLGAHDDSIMVRQYYTEPIAKVVPAKTPEQTAEALQLVKDLMVGINLCAAAEAIAFARYLKVDLDQFYGLVTEAAGSSRVFATSGLEMIRGAVTTQLETAGNGIGEKLVRVTQTARDLSCPLHLGNAALNVLCVAKRRGGVVKVFE
ncbi:hypothetical protein MPDQ_006073 [Monascus purpureus]|uniref:Oxidoreductase n=1 Tax=Monascus purpureus TaxID=5098 RepID=A0A507QV31_MONPU|nr:hypothetical protein MPDQ_006073 [Monascus purpureus]BDD55509.1 hypothetical protein MAP00_001018 [Monascus purpureus]